MYIITWVGLGWVGFGWVGFGVRVFFIACIVVLLLGIVPCPSIGPTTSYKDAPTPTMSTSLASHTSSVSTSIFPFPSANAVSVTSTNNVAIITGDFSASVDDRFLPSLTLSPTVVMPSTGFNSSAIADHISSEGLKPFTDLQNTSSSRNNDSFDNTRTLIIITLIPGFAVILILIFLSMCIILIRIKSSATQSKDATSNADLNNGKYGHNKFSVFLNIF